MTDKSKIIKLIVGFVHGSLTRQEREELDAWIGASAANRDFFETRTNPETIAPARQILLDMDHEAIRRKTDELLERQASPVTPVIAMERSGRNYFRIAASVAAIFIIGWGIYLGTHQRGKNPSTVSTEIAHKDVSIPVDKASLLLGDSSVVELDALSGDRKISQGGSAVKMQDRQLVYFSNMLPGGKEKRPYSPVYNTLHVPVKDSRQLQLPDGTKVWLNAGSSLRYPVPFAEYQREVELKGEAYFEVANNPNAPFTVVAGGWSNIVLGTSFNVRSYEREGMIRTTIGTGSVAISDGTHNPLKLRPGQEMRIDVGKDSIAVLSNVDLESRFAWKEGLFNFRNLDVRTAMRQISQWYGLDEPVMQPGTEKELVGDGSIHRSIDLDVLLSNLGRGGSLQFIHTGNKIFVNR